MPSVRFGVDQPVGGRRPLIDQRSPAGDCINDAASPERAVDRLVLLPAQHADGDLRLPVEVTLSQEPALRIAHRDQVSVGNVSRDPLDGAAKDPGVPIVHRFIPPAFQEQICHASLRIVCHFASAGL